MNAHTTCYAVLLAALLPLGAACGPSTPASNPEPQPDAQPDAQPDTASAMWADMNDGQKMEHMQTVVMPKMSEVFKAHDAERYAKVTCATCHGEGAKKGQFHMPSPDLPKLPPNGQFEELTKSKPEVMKFMMEKVVPEMVAALPGVKGFDPATGQGFGCYGCHQASE